jgi:sulfur relay (sulfurtransferase) complex TusBCD TusD component (DsrE family)
MEKKKLGILLSTAPSDPNVTTAVRLSQEALASNIDVYLYLVDEGVRNLRDSRLLTLSGEGARFFVCAYGCQRHGVSTQGLDPRITLCGLVVLSNIVNGCDRFVALN